MEFGQRRVVFSGGGSGSWQDVEETPSIVVCILDGAYPVPPPHMRVAKYFPKFVPVISPDYQAPRMPAQFWRDLVDDIRTDKTITRVHFQCQGGHGRTGTFMSIVLGLLTTGKEGPKYKTTKELIEKVREFYCEKAVESKAQVEYIAKVCNIAYEEIAMKSSAIAGYGYSYGNDGDGGWWQGGKFSANPPATKTSQTKRTKLGREAFLFRARALFGSIGTEDLEDAWKDYQSQHDFCAYFPCENMLSHKTVFIGGVEDGPRMTFEEFCDLLDEFEYAPEEPKLSSLYDEYLRNENGVVKLKYSDGTEEVCAMDDQRFFEDDSAITEDADPSQKLIDTDFTQLCRKNGIAQDADEISRLWKKYQDAASSIVQVDEKRRFDFETGDWV